ncbi:ribosome quality control complex subunit NEMF homolog [Tribolium castaneum]|uniref:ribosome quality control complex subunit NEMF homolog n=1 Tax=Tribolium castaneum TaxID=7070 RepID=UPI0030FE9248
MKTRFNTFDIICTVTELQKCVGMRVNNVYDIDNKTYLIRLQRSEEKAVILLESGNRFHETGFEWPKNVAPSGFSMKLRKHLKNKRLESLAQLGTDRIVDFQFGSGEAAYHVILELYDKGNIILTDFEFTILNVLRPHTEGDRFKFVVREKYPQDRARQSSLITRDELVQLLKAAKNGDQLKKVLVPNLEYGPPLIEHVLLKQGFSNSTKIGKTFNIESDVDKVLCALEEAENLFSEAKKTGFKGYIIQKKEERVVSADNSEKEYYYSNQEFHPVLYEQHKSSISKEFPSFNSAVDEFFSSLESQKLELKALQQEREALKKLENVKKDHSQRLLALEKTQEIDKQKAELITRNQELVDKAILAVQTALATQISWSDLADLIKEAASQGDEIAQRIKELKLETNHISLYLTDPYAEDDSESDDEDNDDKIPPMVVDVDLDLSAFANGRRYYDQKRNAAKKQQKTIESQSKAFKSAEKKTKQTLKDVQTITNINKARKVYWFEKFFWFISSENYLVIAGRDQQQNELIVKRYMKSTDVYVHADVHGASSVVIKNPSGQAVPPKTLNEAGTMAICYSVAWDAKVVTNAYWVWGEQVSKTAPTGEYLSTGSFMIRGKKNFLPLSHLILGLSFLFKLEESCIEKHKDERRVIAPGEEDFVETVESENKDEVEVEVLDESDEENKEEVKSAADKEIENEENSSSSEDEESSKFPDTQIKIQHFEGTKINILTEPVIRNDETDENETVVYLGDNKPVVVKPNQRSRNTSESKTKQPKNDAKNERKEETNNKQTKRGQKSKLKKIKEKYKDQDEEERKLRMEILQSAGSQKESKKNKKNKNTNKAKKPEQPKIIKERILPVQKSEMIDDGGAEDEEPVVQAELDMINSLTGVPFADDELLFAVPVVAPYNALTNYKFKIKITPGTSRRGKAARTAVNMFLKDRSITPREKDLLKAVKDEQLPRNLPGKVKLSAPKLQTLRK